MSSEDSPERTINQSIQQAIFSRGSRGAARRENDKKNKQLADYTAWVNNYLKRKPGVPLITDIRSNLQDGVSLVNLVEIVSRAELEGVERYPTNAEARQNNIELAVHFLRADGVNFQSDPVKDILEGSSKGIMKVVLGMAERYQPRSVKPRSTSDPKPFNIHRPAENTPNRYKFVDGPVRTHSPDIAPVRRTNLTTTSFSSPNIHQISPALAAGVSLSQTIPAAPVHPLEPITLSQPVAFQAPPTAPPTSLADQEKDMYAMPVDFLPPSASARLITPIRKKGVQLKLKKPRVPVRSIPEDHQAMDPRRPSLGSTSLGGASLTADPAMLNELGEVVNGLNEFKTELLQLHALLLRNNDGSSLSVMRRGEGGVAEKGVGSHDTPLEVNSLAMLMEKQHIITERSSQVSSLKEELQQVSDERAQLEAECSALRGMVGERDSFIKTMKTEIYRKEYRNDTAKVDLHNQLLQRDAVIKKLEGELQSCQTTADVHQTSVEEISAKLRDYKSQEAELKQEMERLKHELVRVSSTEDSLSAKVASRDRKISHLEDRVADLQENRTRKTDSLSEESEAVRESLVSLRRCLPPQDPQQSAIDSLEQVIASLVGKVSESGRISPTGRQRSKRHSHREPDDHHKERRSRRHKHSTHAESAKLEQATAPSSGTATKVIYYMLSDRKETPYLVQVNKRREEITLKDFRSAFDRSGLFKFFVKTEDPDCGVVKVEITADSAILPAWKGQIQVWISERAHQH